MGRKERTTLYINGDVKRKAVELGLNLSQICENGLRHVVFQLPTVIKEGFGQGRQARQATATPREALRPVEPAAGVQIPSPALPQPSVLTPSGLQLPAHLTPAMMTDFKVFLEVDLRRKPLTVKGHVQHVKSFLRWLGNKPTTTEVIRTYLQVVQATRPGAYKNTLSALKVFFREFKQRPDLVGTFHFPAKELELKRIPPKADLQTFYKALADLDLRMAGYFLLYATSGWRRREVMALYREDADLQARTLTPRVKSTTTKGRLPGFFNEEAQKVLEEWQRIRTDASPKLLPISERTFRAFWHQAAEACGVKIQPQLLRDWFCEEMGNRKVSDRYIDAFCGRIPKSVLAKHYTDYAPEKLKKIYDRARLTVLA